MIDMLYLGLYRFFGSLLRFLSDRSVIGLMSGLSKFAYMVGSKHRKIIHKNLNLAFDNTMSDEEKKAIGISAYMNLLDTVFGIMRREQMQKSQVIEHITFEGSHIVEEAKKSGKKIIFVTGHYGNWELISQALAIKYDLQLVGVGRQLDSLVMDEVLKKNRERFNVEMVYKKGAMKGCIQALNQNKAVGILIDQSLPEKQGIKVEFFGQPATHTTLASILARRYEVALIPVFIETEDYIDYHATIHTPINYQKTDNQEADIAAMTQAQADMMEQLIRKNPKQWFWQHKRWKVFLREMYG